MSLGFAAIDWIEHYLVHGPGDVQGKPIELDDELAAFIVKAYALHPSGDRRVRRAFLSRPKGRNKSGLAAMIACFEALGPARFDHFAEAGEVSPWGYEYEPGEPVGKPLTYVEVLNVATEEGQAGNTYDAIHYMLNPDTCSPELLAEFGKIDVGLTRTNLPNKRGFIEPVTASNESKDGGKSTFIVADETHLWTPSAGGKFKLGKMHQTMVRNLLKRKIASGWMLETSTMYAEGEGSVAEGTHAYAKRLGARDGKLLFDHRQASDHWDLNKRGDRVKALRESYGPAAAWMDLQAIADYWDDPQASHAEFRRFWLNQPVPTVEPAPSIMPNWDALAVTTPPPPPQAVALAVDVDRVWASIGAASGGDVPHVGSVRRDRLGPWVASELARIQAAHGCAVVIDRKGPAGSLEDSLAAAGVVVTPAGLDDYVAACADLYDLARVGALTHGNYDDLNAAVAAADWRKVGDRQVWARRNGDVSMLEATTLALWGTKHQVPTIYAWPDDDEEDL